jgi:hypothetical protein
MKFALAVCVVVLGCASSASAQQQACLHDRTETPANKTRRERALDVAQRINMMERMGPPLRPGQRYRPFEDLTMIPAIPDGFTLQFHTDGNSYSFSLKDTRDACGYAIFSDQEGLIYEAIPMRNQARVTPLGTR